MITADTESDMRLVIATARAVFAAGGKPLVMWTSSPLGPGKMVDDWLPSESILAAALKADTSPCFLSFLVDDNIRDRIACLIGKV